MAEERKLKGTVLDKRGLRYERALIRLEGERGETAIESSDDDGDFAFDLTDKEKWPAGRYALTVFHESLHTPLEPRELNLAEDEPPAHQRIELAAKQEVSKAAGIVFMLVMWLALGGLLFGYFYLHRARSNWNSRPFNEDLTFIVRTALTQAEQAKVIDASSPAADSVNVGAGVFESLQQGEEPLFEANKAKIVGSLFNQAKEAGDHGEKADLLTALKALDEALLDRSAFFWSFYPWRLLEVLFWALGATLIRLIFNAGWNIYKHRFYRNAIPHHLALIVTAPILAVLIAFVLSLVKVSIKLSDLELDLDMTNVAISILVGALIGLAPWKAWDYMRDLADTLFKSLPRGSQDGNETSPAP